MQNLPRSNSRFFLLPLLALAFAFSGLVKAEAAEESPRQTVERLYKFIFANDQNPREKELPAIRDEFDPKFYQSLIKAFNLPEAGLDFVPFTNAQDTVGAYHVGTPEVDGTKASVPVSFGNSPKPTVKIELVLVGEKWLVKDVDYPATSDMEEFRLSKILAELLK